jgi:prophage regulatory protein
MGGFMTISTETTRILRLPDVKNRTGLSRSTIYALVKNDCFPKYISLGVRSVGWVEREVEAWITSRVNASRTVQRTGSKAAEASPAAFVNTIQSGSPL